MKTINRLINFCAIAAAIILFACKPKADSTTTRTLAAETESTSATPSREAVAVPLKEQEVIVPRELTEVPQSALEPIGFPGVSFSGGRDEPAKAVSIMPGSPAQDAGFEIGDLLLQLGEKKIENYEEY